MQENIVVKIGADVSKLASDLNKATADIKGFGAATSTSMNGAVKDMRVYEDATGRLRDANGKFLSSAEKTARGLNDIGDNAGDAGNKLNDFGNNAKSVGTSMATSFGAATLAIGAGLGFAVKKAADFDSALRKAGAIAGASAKELDAMKQSALELGATTSESASSVAVAMTELAAKGFNASQVIAAMPGIISAAEASGEDLALAADTVATALNVFSLEAGESSRVADILAMSANTSAAGIDDLGYVLKYAGAPAAALGISLEELAASAGILTSAGLDGSNAGTSLRASLLALNNPAKAQRDIMSELGFSVQDASGNAKSLSQIVGELGKSLEGETEAQKVATLGKLVGTEAVSGFLALMKAGPAEIDKMSASLRNSAGASAEAAAAMKAGIGGALENLSGSFESLTITIGDQLVPYVQTLATWLAGLAEKFTGLSEGTKKFLVIGTALVGIFTAIVAAIGITLAIVGSAITGLTAIATAMGITTGAAGLLGATFAVITGPIGLIVAAIVGVIAILVVAYKKIDWFREMVNNAWTTIKDATMVAFNAVSAVISKVITGVVAFVKSQLNVFKAFWDENGKQIMAIVKTYFTLMSTQIKTTMAIIKTIFTNVWTIIYNIVRIAWEGIKLVISNVTTLILGIIQTVLKILKGDWEGAWETIKETTSTMMGNVVTFLKNIDLIQTGKDIIQGLIDGIGSMSGAIMDKVRSIGSSIKNAFTGLFDINSPSRWMRDMIGVNMMDGWIDGIAGMKNAVLSMSEKAAGWMTPMSPTLAYQTPSASAGVRSTSLATGGTSANGGATTNNYYATIDAKNVKDFTSVVKLLDKQTIQRR